ncbi:MAG: RNA repair transcriptional activator RtcR family protein [Bacteroidia bacterium]|nr:RNA repair transcriptional activator RtcR family protein [Bacteroidia bacterium]
MKKEKKVYITWHYTRHGIVYLKHILTLFWQKGLSKDIRFKNAEQVQLMDLFNNPKSKKCKKFVFDEIIYFTAPQPAFDGLESRRFFYKKSILEDNLIIENGLIPVFQDLISDENKDICYNLDLEKQYVKNKYPELYDKFLEFLWRNIHHYSIKTQIQWLLNDTNFKNVYHQNQFKEVELPIQDLRNEQQIYEHLSKYITKNLDFTDNTEYIINITLGSAETQTVWYLLSELDKLPPKHRFIKTYDNKTVEREERFKPFDVVEYPTKLLYEVKKFSIIENTSSEKRELINDLFDTFFRTPFSILIIGERGLGKSKLIKEFAIRHKIQPFIEANAASFADDIMAESELFGYEPGTFTGGLKNGKNGMLIEANNGVFFLDEVHHLSMSVQSKLLKALQKDEEGFMHVRKLGSNKETRIKCKLIFATNKPIQELRNTLFYDFYDRIAQHILRIPALRETPEDREKDWENVWMQMGFSNIPCPKHQEFLSWLKKLDLPGNYRDLQKIAIYYKTYLDFKDEIKKNLKAKSAFEYAKQQYESFHTTQIPNAGYHFEYNKTAKELEEAFHFHLQEWAIKAYSSRKKAAEILQVDERTLNNWKNNSTKNSK